MSTSFQSIAASEAKLKASLIVEKGLGPGVRSITAFAPLENTPNALSVIIQAGVYIYEPDYIVWLDNNTVLDTFTAAAAPRSDYIYIDVVADTSNPVLAISEGVWPPAVVPEGHVFIPLWRIERSVGTEISQADIDSGEDLRIVPSWVGSHDHNYASGAKDLSQLVSKDEIVQVLSGAAGEPTVTISNLAEFTRSGMTEEELIELRSGTETALHQHVSARSIQTPSGTAVPVNGVLNVATAGMVTVTAAGNTVTIGAQADNLGNHTATQNLNMAAYGIIGLQMPGQTPPVSPPDNTWAYGVNKKYVDETTGNSLVGYAKYQAEQHFDLSDTWMIRNLLAGTDPGDAVNYGQLMEKINGLGGTLALLDERYKLGLQGDPLTHLNQRAWGNVNLSGYKIVGSGTINKITDLPATLVTKHYVDTEIASAVEEIYEDIHGFYKNPAEVDLVMSGPNGQKTIVALKNPAASDHAANKAYVDARINYVIGLIPTEPGQAPEGDNLGDHKATMDLDMDGNRVLNVVMPGQDPMDMSINDMLATNRKFVVDLFKGIPQPEIPVTDLSGFAKIGTNFATAKNNLPLNMDVDAGGEVNVRGLNGKGLLVIKKKPSAPGEDVFINSRIQGVEDPIDDNDAVNFKMLKKSNVSLNTIKFMFHFDANNEFRFLGHSMGTLGSVTTITKIKRDTSSSNVWESGYGAYSLYGTHAKFMVGGGPSAAREYTATYHNKNLSNGDPGTPYFPTNMLTRGRTASYTLANVIRPYDLDNEKNIVRAGGCINFEINLSDKKSLTGKLYRAKIYANTSSIAIGISGSQTIISNITQEGILSRQLGTYQQAALLPGISSIYIPMKLYSHSDDVVGPVFTALNPPTMNNGMNPRLPQIGEMSKENSTYFRFSDTGSIVLRVYPLDDAVGSIINQNSQQLSYFVPSTVYTVTLEEISDILP